MNHKKSPHKGPRHRFVIVNDFETAKEMAMSENFSHRYNHFVATHIRGTGERPTGVIATSGDRWRRNRRFSLSTLKGLLQLQLCRFIYFLWFHFVYNEAI